VGSGTAKALKEAGYLVAAHPELNWSSEGLLDLPEFQTIAGKKIAIVRGEGGRELLEKTLLSRGALVSHVIAYQRVLPEIETCPYVDLFKHRQIDVVVCTSYEGVRHFKILLGTNAWLDIKDIPLIVMSERIKTLAHDLGFQTIWVARHASHDAILELLAQKRNELCQIKQMKS
jgi:uroporphyrinogen-III synthase